MKLLRINWHQILSSEWLPTTEQARGMAGDLQVQLADRYRVAAARRSAISVAGSGAAVDGIVHDQRLTIAVKPIIHLVAVMSGCARLQLCSRPVR